jgi:hypothetical protein
MSILAYAKFTTLREEAQPYTSKSESPPGVTTYVDAMLALVPAEVLTLHALMLSATTKVENNVTTITAPETLFWAFFGLLILSTGLYVAKRLSDIKKLQEWGSYDWLRMLIPPLAFIAWTMLQRATAFDAVYPGMSDATRTVIGLFLAVVLGASAAVLGENADKQEPPPASS